jgi:hypothetical protein
VKGTGLPPLLYLDTARLGQMSTAAKDAQLDFVRLSAEEPSSLYFEEFLRGGFSAWPTCYQNRFPGLRTWKGVSGLKIAIRNLVNADDHWQTLLANRSLSLVRLASSCMFRTCRNVLITDLSWPSYMQAIEAEACRTGNRTTKVSVRDAIFSSSWTVADVADYVAERFADNQCDGIFLPAVDHLGIRVPVGRITQAIEKQSRLRFCFIDAAQALCHVALNDCVEAADFIVAGSHKWMGAYLPTGIGLFGQRRTRAITKRCLMSSLQSRDLDDPLLHFTEQLDAGELDGHSETANLTSLFACAGAVAHQAANSLLVRPTSISDQLSTVPRPTADWMPRQPVEAFRSRIVLFETATKTSGGNTAEEIRQAWLDSGCVVTGYADGRARVSFPCSHSAESAAEYGNPMESERRL